MPSGNHIPFYPSVRQGLRVRHRVRPRVREPAGTSVVGCRRLWSTRLTQGELACNHAYRVGFPTPAWVLPLEIDGTWFPYQTPICWPRGDRVVASPPMESRRRRPRRLPHGDPSAAGDGACPLHRRQAGAVSLPRGERHHVGADLVPAVPGGSAVLHPGREEHPDAAVPHRHLRDRWSCQRTMPPVLPKPVLRTVPRLAVQ